ncbi:Aste57867_12498 [Aphanomyces stellatus]|uniref:Aste57867_12498 protein n=1 Tax=Aphanomyces stellatus TaxID=120398 RepID=A0A485KVS7_9STRA|nr:hypothetical protein As57867_012452 [Aphanomyces stellatus]VFT89349.1 Aste57867_12498 [Aphanomyces stellatus]
MLDTLAIVLLSVGALYLICLLGLYIFFVVLAHGTGDCVAKFVASLNPHATPNRPKPSVSANAAYCCLHVAGFLSFIPTATVYILCWPCIALCRGQCDCGADDPDQLQHVPPPFPATASPSPALATSGTCRTCATDLQLPINSGGGVRCLHCGAVHCSRCAAQAIQVALDMHMKPLRCVGGCLATLPTSILREFLSPDAMRRYAAVQPDSQAIAVDDVN